MSAKDNLAEMLRHLELFSLQERAEIEILVEELEQRHFEYQSSLEYAVMIVALKIAIRRGQ